MFNNYPDFDADQNPTIGFHQENSAVSHFGHGNDQKIETGKIKDKQNKTIFAMGVVSMI